MRDHNNERGPRPEHKECGNCGGYPIGIGCSHQCFNSTHYYSPEQERADDAFYGDDDIRERYAGEIIDAEYEMFCADQADAELQREREPDEGWVYIAPPPLLPADDNDIPF
jgi:hypothetical protein